MNAKKPHLYLIDGHALAYRTYFALTGAGGGSRWITKKGEPTAGIYGFTSVLLRLLEERAPDYLAVSFDTGRTFRDDIYPDYKGTREKMPDDLRSQIERIREVVQAFGIPIFEAQGYEADDVLGTVAHQAAGEKTSVTILTGDRDLLQLAKPNVLIELAGQRLSEAVDYGPEEVEARYGLKPEQLVDLKALVGDKSDNIPGVAGVGEKTATRLLQQYGDLDAIYAHLDEISTRFRTKLEAGREAAYLSRELGRIVTDVPIAFDLEACRAQGYDREAVAAIFRDLEFRSLIDRLPSSARAATGAQLSLFKTPSGSSPSSVVEKVEIVDSPAALKRLVARLEEAERIAFDTETTSTDPMRAELVGISLATQVGEGCYIPVGHDPQFAGGEQLGREVVLDALRPALTDAAVEKIAHNAKYDYLVLLRAGLRTEPLSFDTMIAEWLCDPGSRNLGLKDLAWVRLGVEMTKIDELIGKGRERRTMAQVAIADAAPYAAADAEVCLRLVDPLQAEMEAKGHWNLFRTLEMPLVPILADMERAGIMLDLAFLDELSKAFAKRLAEIEAQIFDLVGQSFNINSTQQLSHILFDILELQPPDRARKTASGHYSTAASVLEELRDSHPVIDLILQFREIAKLKSTYADAFPQQVDPVTGRVHTSFSQTGSVTGRLASSDPNLQNIPVRTELGREIRRAFVAEDGHVLLSVDYSQIELRIVAHMSGDKAMIEAFNEDQDIHATTAAAIAHIPLDEVTPELRRRAKAVNFGLIYGMSPFGLSRSTDLTLGEAENFVKSYFERFPGVKAFLDQVRLDVAETGYVATLLGRRRYFPQLTKGAAISEVARSRAMREAINAPIQGSAADIIKLAMLRLPEALSERDLSARMLIQVHDELLFECPAEELPETAELVKGVMQSAYELIVPLKTDAKAGDNWADLSPLSS